MKVKFKRMWWAPTEIRRPDELREMSGKRYRKGVIYDLDEEMVRLATQVNASFEIVDGSTLTKEVVEPGPSLHEADALRANSDALIAAAAEAEKNYEQPRKRGRPRKED